MTAILGFMPAWAWRLVAYAVILIAAASFGALKMHSYDAARYENLEMTYENFKSQTAAEGKLAQVRADQQKANDLKAKEKADADHKTAVDSLNAELDGLRKRGARGNTVPPAPASTSRPDLACFDRTLLGDAIDGFLRDVSSQVTSGAKATLDLDNAKAWARGMKSGN